MLNWSLCYLSYVYIIFAWLDATWVWVPAEAEESSWSRGSEEKAAASHPTCAGNWAWVFCRSHKHSWLLIRLSPWTGYKCLLCLGGTVAFGFQFSLFSVEHLLTHTHFVFSKSPSLLLLMLLLGLQIALLRIQGCSVLCGCCGVMSAPIPWLKWLSTWSPAGGAVVGGYGTLGMGSRLEEVNLILAWGGKRCWSLEPGFSLLLGHGEVSKQLLHTLATMKLSVTTISHPCELNPPNCESTKTPPLLNCFS